MEDGIRNAITLLADALSDASRALMMLTGTGRAEKVIEVKADEQPVREPVKEPVMEARKITKTELRSYMSGLAGRGMKDLVQKVLKEYGVSKLSDVKEEDYQDLMAKLEYYSGDLEKEGT